LIKYKSLKTNLGFSLKSLQTIKYLHIAILDLGSNLTNSRQIKLSLSYLRLSIDLYFNKCFIFSLLNKEIAITRSRRFLLTSITLSISLEFIRKFNQPSLTIDSRKGILYSLRFKISF